MRFIGYDSIQTHILSLSNLHNNNVASIQKNQDDKSHCVIVAYVRTIAHESSGQDRSKSKLSGGYVLRHIYLTTPSLQVSP